MWLVPFSRRKPPAFQADTIASAIVILKTYVFKIRLSAPSQLFCNLLIKKSTQNSILKQKISISFRLNINYPMNRIWFVMIVLSLCFLLYTNPAGVLDTMINASSGAFKLSLELCAIYAVWLGILELVDASGLSEKLAKLLRPLIRKLFKIKDTETEKMIALNMSANMLGLGNASTPMGINAMKRLDDGSGIANHAVIMLIVLNSTSIQLLPSTVIGLRATAGSTSPADIILPTLISTICTFILGIILVKIFGKIHEKIKNKNKKIKKWGGKK